MTDIQNLNYCEDTLKLKSTIESGFLSLGERLLKIRQEQLFAPQWDSFREYVMEMKMSEGTASKLINIYQRFIVEYQISPQLLLNAGGWGVVAEVLSVVTDKQSAEEWLGKAAILSREDIRKEVTEQKTGKLQKDCEHKNTYLIRVCNDCGDRERIYEENTP